MHMLKPPVFYLATVVLAASKLIADDRPNILFIAVDDLTTTLGR